MDPPRRHSLSPAGARKRPRSPETVEDAWRRHCKASVAGSRRATRKYVAWPGTMPPSLVDFASCGRYHSVDPPLKPMTEKFRREWEEERAKKAVWARLRAGEGSSSGGGAPPTGDDDEEEDPLFKEAVATSLKDAADKAEREREEAARDIALVEEMEAREAARNSGVVILDD